MFYLLPNMILGTMLHAWPVFYRLVFENGQITLGDDILSLPMVFSVST